MDHEPTVEEYAAEYANILYDGKPNETNVSLFPDDGPDFNYIKYMREKFRTLPTRTAIKAAFVLKEQQQENN